MALRYCVFKDCHNYFNIPYKCYSKENLTFFQFPKDPQRRQKWMHLGKVQPNLPASYYVLCSDHFDSKYKSKQCRRTSLVGDAVPNPHESLTVSEPTEEVYNIEEFGTDEMPADYYLYEEVNNDFNTATDDNQEQEQHLVESTTITDENLVEVVQSVIESDYHMDMNSASPLCEAKLTDKSVPKRKTFISISPNSSSSAHAKQIKSTRELQLPTDTVASKCFVTEKNDPLLPANADVKESQRTDVALNTAGRSNDEMFENKTENNPINLEEQYIDLDTLVDTHSVTVFIFKGEEYVQMPKDYYVKEKVDLMDKLKKLENIIENIKNQCNRM